MASLKLSPTCATSFLNYNDNVKQLYMMESPTLALFEEAITENGSFLIEELWSAPKAYLASLIVQKTGRSLLIITGGTREDCLFDDLSYFAKPLEFPAWETLPGEEIPPSPDILGKRFEALHALLHTKEPTIVLCPLHALLQKIPPKEVLHPLLSIWQVGLDLPFEILPEYLTSIGYKRSAVASDKGEFAVRGGILDLFPVASPDPYRIEFMGDTIEQIRTFDPVGQKSTGKQQQLFLCPAQELPLLQKAPRLVSILEYLGPNTMLLWDDLLSIEDAATALKAMPGAKTPFFYSLEHFFQEPHHFFCTADKIETLSPIQKSSERTKHFQSISFDMFNHTFHAKRFFHPFRPALDALERPDCELVFLDLAKEEIKHPIPPTARFEQGYLSSGFFLPDIPFSIIPNAEITQKTHIRRQKWRNTVHTPASEFHELTPGDFVVHYHSGIGKFCGIEKQVNHLGQETEFLSLEYNEGSRLFVPISQASLVSRYIGAKEEPPSLSQLGSKRWQTIRVQAQAQIVGYANDLLQLYAERAANGGFRFPPDGDLMRQFESDFPYDETQDQLLAIAAIKEDMLSDKPMDRLICGDVGYGKTEVAMRAAFKAVVDGAKQVAVLVPTTVLAMQHYDTFCQRMGSFPVRIDVASRFRTAKQTKETLDKVARGEVDILIGTHRLLSKDVHFKDLGLIIVDEEQRFGVRAKESLKKFKTGVDCLTLSATPIPRTLYMSLIQARDVSTINTPPQDRLPVKTIIAETDSDLIQNALLRELAREGQAFYIHNRVETIYGRAEAIQTLVPAARIGIVHGQMDPDAVDAIFHRFKLGELDLLFATTIVENGVDVSNANTILIDRADTYGLADLYQLRGRVGRWNRAAYAYFLIPKDVRLPEIARKRLNALVEASGYGGGIKIATRDLEIRGAGDILGTQQSGQVSSIGFHLYCKLLKRAIDSLKKQKPISFTETKMEFSYDARFPDTYIPEVSLRMELYYRLGDATTPQEIDSLLNELTDRFGPPPPPTLWLYHLSRIRTLASSHHFTLLKFAPPTLLAEKQKGKEVEKLSFPLPKKFETPEELERYVSEQLQKS